MKLHINEGAIKITEELEKRGYEAYVVGGAIRDTLLERPNKDWDVTTSAKPEEMLPLFEESFYDNAYGTVMVAGKHLKKQFNLAPETCEDEEIYDITTFRSEHGYSDKRRPDAVEWGKQITDDLKRRDFTINAMAAKIIKVLEAGMCEVRMIDPYQGKDDLKAGVIRAVGKAEERFEEDALRILRAVRIAAQLGFKIEEETLNAIGKKSENLKQISWERIGEEMRKILATEYAAQAILLMASTGILKVILPELLQAKGVKQAGHHIYDVFTHCVEALRACPSPDPVVRLATLLHDIDKPVVLGEVGGKITFYNHEVSGARTAKKIAERLKFSKNEQNRIFTLVRWHMFAYDSKMTDAAIRRFIRRVGKENIHDMMALRIGDRVGGGSKATSWRLTELQTRIGEQFYEPLSLKDLAIDGSEVMQILGIPPSRRVGEILNILFEEILEDSSKNTTEYLSLRVKELV